MSPFDPLSASVAFTVIILVPVFVFSTTVALYTGWLKTGILSLASITVTSIFTVPDLCGVPPSTAINFKEKCGCRSLSKGFWSTISTYLLPSGFALCWLRTKFSFSFKE
uniref:Uncharacterized protein n=1 Tax=Amphilophus citrinellus TaxID=61819 RepID=A0A3Q0S3H5_AMPCI